MLLTGVVLVHRNQLFRDSLRQLLRNLRYSVVTEGVSLGAVLASGTLPDQVEIAIWSSDGLAGSQNGEIGLLRRLKEAIPSIRLVALLETSEKSGIMVTPAREVVDIWRAKSRTLEGIEAYDERTVTLSGSSEPERMSAVLASGVSACRFSYDASVVASRAGLVQLQLTLATTTSAGTERVALYHAVHVDNLP